MDIQATNPGGFPEHTIRTVRENAETLGLDEKGFESE